MQLRWMLRARHIYNTSSLSILDVSLLSEQRTIFGMYLVFFGYLLIWLCLPIPYQVVAQVLLSTAVHTTYYICMLS